MLSLLRTLFAPARRPARRAAGRTRLGLETLETREVLSATTTSMVTDSLHDQVEFNIASDHSVVSNDATGTHQLGGFALATCGSVDATGKAEDFVIGADHSLWKFDNGAWKSCGGGMTAISSNLHDTCFALGANGSVWEFNSSGWHALGGVATDLSASEEQAGSSASDDVFVVAGDRSLWEFNSSGWHALGGVVGGPISATQDGSCFVVATDHSLWEHSLGGWQSLGGGNITSISAGVVAVGADGNEIGDDSGGHGGHGADDGVISPTGAHNEDVCYVTSSGSAVYMRDGNGWQSFGGAATQVAGNQFAGASDDVAGTQNETFWANGTDNNLYSHSSGGWQGHGHD
jgi:hypothetical protein